jgi:hypothetical protein
MQRRASRPCLHAGRGLASAEVRKMPTLRAEAQVSPDELLQAVDQLGMADLERFVSRVLALRAL